MPTNKRRLVSETCWYCEGERHIYRELNCGCKEHVVCRVCEGSGTTKKWVE